MKTVQLAAAAVAVRYLRGASHAVATGEAEARKPLLRTLANTLLLLGAVLLVAQSARAACDPNLPPVITVSVGSWQTNGTIQATATNTYPRNDGFLESLYVYLDVVDSAHLQWSGVVGSGVPHTVTVHTSCFPAGPHTVIARGGNCVLWGQASAGFDVGASEPTISASLINGFDTVGNGTLSINYNFPNTEDYRQREIFVELDGSYIANSKRQPGNVSGSYTYGVSIACLSSGQHTFTVRARPCGDPSRDVTTAVPVSVDNTPQITLNLSPPDSSGNVTISGSVYFPHSPDFAYSARNIYVYVNSEPNPRWNDGNNNFNPNGIGPHTINVTCGGPYTVRVVATRCGGASATKQASGGAPGMTKPALTLKYTGFNTQTFRAKLRATIHWAFPLPSSGWNVELRVASWIDSSGNVQPGYSLGGPSLILEAGDWSRDFDAPSEARQIVVMATMTSCLGSGTDTVARELADCGTTSPSGTHDPVAFADGDVRYSDNDPLPPLLDTIVLARTYDSQEGMLRLFGRGWMTFLDQRLVTVSSPVPLVYFVGADSGVVIFEQTGSTYVQRWPKAVSAAGSLHYDAASSVYEYRPARRGMISRFRASDGRFIGYRHTSGRTVDVALDASGLPLSATDSWTGVVWQFHLDAAAHRVTSIDIGGRPDLLWMYTYDGNGALTSVLAPGSTTWRTYTYGTWGMTAAYDAVGNLIESHMYDASGFGSSSTGPNDEISSIEYGLAAPNPLDTITRVTTRTGAIIDYTLRAAGGTYRTVHVNGGCASCGARNSVYVLDEDGRIVRQQTAQGYVTQSSYTGSNLTSILTNLKPSGCDPQTAPDHCKLTEDSLVSTTLDATTATMTTTYTYGDLLWPERPTQVDTTSVLNPSGTRTEIITYDATTGTVLTRSISGWTGSVAHPVSETHTTTTTLYGSNEVAAFDPGGAFSSGWLSLPQPANRRRSIDAPRTDVTDATTFVYYPVDSTVPATSRGRLAAEKNAAGKITRYENYDLFGNAQRVVDANGVAREFAFDAFGRLLATTVKGVSGCDKTADPLCETDLIMSRAYTSASGPLASESDANSNVTSYEYDTRGRTVAVSRGPSASLLKERMESSYDVATGRKSLERYLAMENGSWVEKKRESFIYDTLAQLIAQVHADNTSVAYTYNDDGTVATVRDENHTTANTFYAYGPGGRLASAKQTLGNGQIATSYSYDVAGNVTSVVDPNGNTTTYFYDDFGQVLSQTSPVNGTTTYGYDAAGDQTSVTDANNAVTTRTFDALGRALTSVSTAGTSTETTTWTYDGTMPFGVGHKTSMTDAAGSVTYTYDRRGLLLSESRSSGSVSLPASFKYDAAGNRTTIMYPDGSAAVYTYDHAGRPLSLAASGVTYVQGATYLPFGPETALTFSNGTTQTRTYDARYRIQRNTLTTATGAIADYTYSEDAVGNITSIYDLLDSTYNRDFAYDDLNRLTTANTGLSLWGSGSYRYDAMGNLLARDLGGTVEVDPNDPLSRRGGLSAVSNALPASGSIHETYSYASTTSQLATVTSSGIDHPVTYDAAGNELRYYDMRTYSPRNLMTSITEPSEDDRSHTINYTYDGRGVRLIRSEGTTGYATPFANRYYVYTPDMHLLAVSVDDNPNVWGKKAIANAVPAMKRMIAWFNDRPVLELVDGTLRYTFTDHLGTPLLQTDVSVSVVWRAEYEPYGDIWTMRGAGAPTDQILRFPGQEYAGKWEGSEERYNIFRWYRAGWGRYTQPDPKGMSADLNLYRYVRNMPIEAFDPLGLQLYVPNYPPNVPPRGCTASSWAYTGSKDSVYRTRSVWELTAEQEVEVGSEEDPEGHGAVSCICYYKEVGIRHSIDRWDMFRRSVCCGGKLSTETTRTRNSSSGHYDEEVLSSRTATVKFPAGGGKCLCPEEYESAP